MSFTFDVTYSSRSAQYESVFGWYDARTGLGGILFGSDGCDRPDVGDTVRFTANVASASDIQFFLIADGLRLNRASEVQSGQAIRVITLSNGTSVVALADAAGNVEYGRHGRPEILDGRGEDAFFTETARNRGGVDYASSVAGRHQTAATLAGDTADGPEGRIAWEDLAATRLRNGTYSRPGDADYNDQVYDIRAVTAANLPPVVKGPLTLAAMEDAVRSFDLLATARDPEGQPLSVVGLAGLVPSLSAAVATLTVDGTQAGFQNQVGSGSPREPDSGQVLRRRAAKPISPSPASINA